MTTMREVAERAGVSISTVSRVISRTQFVSDETRQRVRVAMDELGYPYQSPTRPQSRDAPQTIGVVVSSILDEFSSRLVESIMDELEKRKYTLLLAQARDNPRVELQAVKSLDHRGIQGLLLCPFGNNESATLAYLRRRDLPTVLLDRCIDSDFDQIGTENRMATAVLVEHLIGLGHHRIALLHSLPKIATTRERIEGYRLALHRNGIKHVPSLEVSGGAARGPARGAVLNLMNQSNRPTGLVVCNDPMSLGALDAFRELGLRVPEDIALVCFDDGYSSDHLYPPLTTGSQAVEQIAREGVRMLFERLHDLDTPPRSVRTRTGFHDRSSCGCVN